MSALGAFCRCDGAGCHWEFFYHHSGNGIWDGAGRGLREGVVMVSRRTSLTFPSRLRPPPLLPGLERNLDIVLISFVLEASRPIWPKQLHPIDKLFKTAYTHRFHRYTRVAGVGVCVCVCRGWGRAGGRGGVNRKLWSFLCYNISISETLGRFLKIHSRQQNKTYM